MDLKEKLKIITEKWVQATEENFTNHPTANFFKRNFKEEIDALVNDFDDSYKVKASVGAGNWANIPWLSILNPIITTTTQDGIYPVYLFNADGSGFYLSLIQGTTIPSKDLGKKAAEERAEKIKNIILTKIPELVTWGVQDIDLKAETSLGKSYEKSNISAKYYNAKSIPESEIIKQDLIVLLKLYQQIEKINFVHELNDFEPKMQKNSEYFNNIPLVYIPLSKPFLLLAGISGTGKSRFVREQAKSSGNLDENYCLTSVRPDWHEPSDLLGYISRLNGKAEYVTTDILQFMAKAWRAIVDAKLTVSEKYVEGLGKKLIIDGHKTQLDRLDPYWVCLDEMNLAPVEQYFSDYLSVIETRDWRWENEEFEYLCDPLLKPASIAQLATPDTLRRELGLEESQYDELWGLFCKHGISIPFNLIVAGTVNMDETTHGFSRKVIDRALSFDFGEFYPNNFADYFTPNTINKTFSYPIFSHVKQDDLPSIDADGKKSIAFLNAINTVLDNTPFKLAFRALNELLLSVVSMKPQDDLALQAVWDDFLMCKVLPRIEGDCDKLASNTVGMSLLNQLSMLLTTELSTCWEALKDSDNARPDFYREQINSKNPIRIACRSKAKIEWMQQRLTNCGFTSFWP